MKVGVIMGGISSEREISLNSGNSIMENIDKNKYDVVPVVIDEKADIINKVKYKNASITHNNKSATQLTKQSKT